MHRRHSSLAILTLGLCLNACATSPDALKPFPAAAAGYQRHVIELPERANEADHRVELMAGKTQMIDCNHHRLGGQWQEKNVEGWGYTYYELSAIGPGMSTMMSCPNNTQREAFVPAGGEPLLVRYNSKLPLVIYTPVEAELRYRIWSAAPNAQAVPAQ